MSILSKLLGGGSNPADSAMPYLNQISGVGHQYYDPYVNQGLAAGQKAQDQYDTLMNDPTGFINKLMESYKPSEGYQFQKDELTRGMGNTAAAGGFAGTNYDQMQQAQGVQGLLSKDMQQYLQNALGIYGTGLEGEQGIANQGFQASGSLADYLGSNLGQQGQLAFQGKAQQNANKTSMINSLIKALGMAGGMGAFGGLGSLGSLAGGGFGSNMYGGG
jgi:hypothetical protein